MLRMHMYVYIIVVALIKSWNQVKILWYRTSKTISPVSKYISVWIIDELDYRGPWNLKNIAHSKESKRYNCQWCPDTMSVESIRVRNLILLCTLYATWLAPAIPIRPYWNQLVFLLELLMPYMWFLNGQLFKVDIWKICALAEKINYSFLILFDLSHSWEHDFEYWILRL